MLLGVPMYLNSNYFKKFGKSLSAVDKIRLTMCSGNCYSKIKYLELKIFIYSRTSVFTNKLSYYNYFFCLCEPELLN